MLSFRNLRLIRELEPDIVHDPTDEFPQVSLFVWYYGLNEPHPYVITSHESSHGGSSGLLRVADLVLSLMPDFDKSAAVVHSERQREELQAQNRSIESVHVIPHGIYTFFRELDYTERPERENHALFFGSLIPPKGIEFLIESVPSIVERIPDFTLTVAGSGTIPQKCRATVEQYAEHIDIRNEFVPNEEVGELFSRAQVIVLPYRDGWQTGHSGTLSVAFAFSKPVVTTRVGDFPRLVDETGAGVVVEPENVEALADGVVRVLSDDTARAEMAEASEGVAETFSWERVAEEHMELYEQLLDRRQM
jgi:glycosyltransferase involved in cell wall biosynthesis